MTKPAASRFHRLVASSAAAVIIALTTTTPSATTTTTFFCHGFVVTPTTVVTNTNVVNVKAKVKVKLPLPSGGGRRSLLSSTSLYVLPVDPTDLAHQVAALQHGTAGTAMASPFSDFFQTLSEAAVAVGTTTAAPVATAAASASASDDGWWSAYLNIFKSALLLVHNTIDGPLRSVGWTQTWGLSIALFTAGVRSMLIPLSVQQSKSSEYLKALRPYVSEIKEKFANNQDAQNRAIGKLYEDANQNPLSGCLFSLAQLPIFLGLYRGVRLLARDGVLDEPFLWIPSLQGPVTAESNYQGLDWLTQHWTTIDGTLTPSLGWETTLAFCVMPVLLVLGQSLTMNVLQPPPDENASDQEREQLEKTQGFLKFLPLMIGFFSLQVPAGLTIYWATSNAFTLTQSLAVRKYYEANPPNIELPDYWDSLDNMDAMTVEEKRQAAKAGIAIGPTLDDLIAESKFHTVVERTPLRANSEAWERAVVALDGGGPPNNNNNNNIPGELQLWVQEASPANGAFVTNGSAAHDGGASTSVASKEVEGAAPVTQSSSA